MSREILADPGAAIERWAQGEDIPRLAGSDWLAVAAAAANRFVWVLDPGRVLPLDDDTAAALWTTLKPALAREDLSIALGWLAQAGLATDEQAAHLLDSRLTEEAEGCAWSLLTDALLTLARRGAPWRAARILEAQLEGAGLEPDEVARVERAALTFMDGPLLAAAARNPYWRDDEPALARFAAGAETASLIDNFGSRRLAQRLRLSRETGTRLQAAVWRTLASRAEPEALAAVQKLVIAVAGEPETAELATALAGLLQQTHGKAALPAMVSAFVSGLHHSPAGEIIERWLMQYPTACLQETLDPFPEERHRFDTSALRRLCFLLLPRLTPQQRSDIGDLAEVAGGPRARVVREELALLDG